MPRALDHPKDVILEGVAKMANQTKFEYSMYPKEYGQYIRLDNGVLKIGDWEGNRDFTVPADATRDLYEALKQQYGDQDG